MAPVQSKPLLVVVVPRRASLPRKCKHTTTARAPTMATRATTKKKTFIPFFSDSTVASEDNQDPTLSKPGSCSDDSAPEEGSVSCVPHSVAESVTSLENYTPIGECCYHIDINTCTMSQLKDAYVRLRFFYASVYQTFSSTRDKCENLEAIIDSLNKKIKSLQTTHRAAITKLVNQHSKDEKIWNKITNKHLQEEVALRFAIAERFDQLTDEIRTHYPIIESDIPIKQEQE